MSNIFNNAIFNNTMFSNTVFGGIGDAFTPLSLSPALWLDASDTSTINTVGSSVTQWDDKSGNGYNATQGTAADQPSSGTRTINGLNVIDFESQFLNITGVGHSPSDTGFTCFLVSSADTDVNAFVNPYSGGVGDWRYEINSDPFNMTFYDSVSGINGVDLGLSRNTNVTVYHKDSSNNSAYYNGGVAVTGTGTPSFADNRTIGARSSGGTNLYNGVICEIIEFDRALTVNELNTIGKYLERWGITWTNI